MPRRSTKDIFWDGAYYSASDLLDRELKQCATCKEVKPVIAFYPRGNSGYYTSNCKACDGDKYRANADVIREKRRETRQGVPPGTYDMLVRRHGSICMMCGTDDPGGTGSANRQFAVDHDHETGVIRGLLCNTCNVGIGMLKHDPRLLMAAIHYIRQEGYTIEQIKKLLVDDLASW